MDAEQRLLARLNELDSRLHSIEDALEQPRSPDAKEQAIEREDDEILQRIGIAGQQEIAGIKAALKRMTTGDYGYCMACGAEIPQARLDILPATPFCKTCVH